MDSQDGFSVNNKLSLQHFKGKEIFCYCLYRAPKYIAVAYPKITIDRCLGKLWNGILDQIKLLFNLFNPLLYSFQQKSQRVHFDLDSMCLCITCRENLLKLVSAWYCILLCLLIWLRFISIANGGTNHLLVITGLPTLEKN